MKLICSLSSLEFSCEHFPGTHYSRNIVHPIFQLEQKKLLAYAGQWAQSNLTPTDSYLLFLAILHSSDLVIFRTPAHRTARTDSIVAQNMEPLMRCIIRIQAVPGYADKFPPVVITQGTSDLSNAADWIKLWEESYTGIKAGYKSAHESAAVIRREQALLRLIRSPHVPASSYANQLADWAVIAGSFPNFPVTVQIARGVTGTIPCKDYWKQIILRAARNEVISIDAKDLQELLDHCAENIDVGSLYANALFTTLRNAQKKLANFLTLGDVDIKSDYVLLAPGATNASEADLVNNLIASAPETEPVRSAYPTEFAYTRARMKWKLAQAQKRQTS